MIELEQVKNQISRRMSYARACLKNKEVGVDWEELQEKLSSCSTLQDVSQWLEVVWRVNGEKSFWPVLEYAHNIIRRRSSTAYYEVEREALSKSEINEIEVLRIPETSMEGAFEWGHEGLLAWAPWVPRIDTGQFETVFAKDIDADNSGLQECIEQIVPEGPGEALILQYYDYGAAIVESATIRRSWENLLQGSDDLVIIPVSPTVADWIICYFHHGLLEVGKLKNDWRHRLSLKT